MSEPAEALVEIAARLRSDGSVLSERVRDPRSEARLGELVAGGPRAARAPGEYAQVIEAVREGYLLHYGEPRLLVELDGDLALLAGDYLYAQGLDRLAALEDTVAVRELSDLISLAAQAHAVNGARPAGATELWLASTIAVAAGASRDHEAAKDDLRDGNADAPETLLSVARARAEEAGLIERLEAAARSIGFRSEAPPERG